MTAANRFLVAAVVAALIPTAFIPATVSSAFAAEIKIVDCDGAPRAIREVLDGTTSSVEIRVTDKSGAAVSDVGFILSSLSSGSLSSGSLSGSGVSDNKTWTALVVDGKGGFKDVGPGAWKMCPKPGTAAAAQAIVSQVAVITNDESGTTNAAAWLGGGGVAVTGIGLGVFSGRGSSDNTVPSSTGGDVDSGGNGEPSTAPLLPAEDSSSGNGSSNSGKKPDSGKIACPATEDCLNDERPDALPPVSPST